MMHTALITTTINVPRLLLDYARDAKAYNRAVKFIVSGDRKTPPQAAEWCAQLTRDTGVECEYMSVAAQENFMRDYKTLNAHLPWDCVQRRNVAILRAAAEGADIVITIDDDNFLACEDYFGKQQITGQERCLETYGNAGEWFNVCGFLKEENGRAFFPRGYGITPRHPAAAAAVSAPSLQSKKIVVNAGLWLGDPDIDATTRLAAPVNAVEYSRGQKENFFVAAGAWTPFNSQNTAIARQALAAYFLSPYVGRYDDIFISFFVKRIADHFGHGVSFGHPLVRQERNAHDLLHDLMLENLGMKITDDLIAVLMRADLQGSNYADCLIELTVHCEQALRDNGAINNLERAQMSAFFSGCRIWAELPIWQQG